MLFIDSKVIRTERVVGHCSTEVEIAYDAGSIPILSVTAAAECSGPSSASGSKGVEESTSRQPDKFTSRGRIGDVDVAKQDRRMPLFDQRLVGKNLEIALRGLDANHVLGHEDSKQFQLSVHPEVCIRRAGPAEFTCRAGQPGSGRIH